MLTDDTKAAFELFCNRATFSTFKECAETQAEAYLMRDAVYAIIAFLKDDVINRVDVSNREIKIVVADRGFVYVGYVTLARGFAIVERAYNIRVWGTKAGLGELVTGPAESTKLDKVGIVRIPMRAVISLIDVEASEWESKLS